MCLLVLFFARRMNGRAIRQAACIYSLEWNVVQVALEGSGKTEEVTAFSRKHGVGLK
jgi:hypothetical protein